MEFLNDITFRQNGQLKFAGSASESIFGGEKGYNRSVLIHHNCM